MERFTKNILTSILIFILGFVIVLFLTTLIPVQPIELSYLLGITLSILFLSSLITFFSLSIINEIKRISKKE